MCVCVFVCVCVRERERERERARGRSVCGAPVCNRTPSFNSRLAHDVNVCLETRADLSILVEDGEVRGEVTLVILHGAVSPEKGVGGGSFGTKRGEGGGEEPRYEER